ncbi:MAG: hypothetical protein KIT81_14810, partial [Alphaproteobacteria bacterium]|nr:hypothetical protein [Alphaproteobacteria bacterium]
AHGIKVDEIANNILSGICEPASSPFTPATFGYLDGLPRIPYDLAKARQLLQEAGIKPGHKVTFNLHTQSFAALPNAPQVLEAIAGNLEAMGFVVERQATDSGAWLQMMRGGRHPMIYYGPSSSPDDGGETINAYYVSWSGWTNGNIKVPEYDEVYKQQLAAFNPEERIRILQRFARLESERLESPPLFWCHTPFALSSRVKTFKPAVSSAYHINLRELELAN